MCSYLTGAGAQAAPSRPRPPPLRNSEKLGAGKARRVSQVIRCLGSRDGILRRPEIARRHLETPKSYEHTASHAFFFKKCVQALFDKCHKITILVNFRFLPNSLRNRQ